jgi:enhancing lycopene biosynthesis protein 2
MESGRYYAYQLSGYFAFAKADDDAKVKEELRRKVKFLADDAPALTSSLDPYGTIAITDLGMACKQSIADDVQAVRALANAGKGLTRTPVEEVLIGRHNKLILSQIITHGRLDPNIRGSASNIYKLHYDPAAVQFVLNALAEATVQ